MTVVVDNIVLHVLLLVDALVIVLVSVGELVRVLAKLNGISASTSLFLVLSLLMTLLVMLLAHVDVRIELDLPLLNESVVVNDVIKRVALVFELLIFGLVSVGNLVGWKFLVLELEHHSVLDAHVHLRFELKLPLLDKSVIVDDIVSWIILVFELFVLSLVSVSDLVGWDLLVLEGSLALALVSKVDLGSELNLPLLDEAIVIDNVVGGIVLVLKLFIFGLVSVGDLI